MSARWIAVSLFLLAGPGFAAGTSAGSAGGAGRLVRVPQDARTLAQALGRVADGGVVEMAAGVYPSPPSGFLINNARKGFTVRAAAGAKVAIDGGGVRSLLRFVNSDRARGKRVTFQGIAFQNGGSSAVGGTAVLISAAEAVFQNCSFLNNRAGSTATGGGAVRVLQGASATFVDSAFRGNSSVFRGGALEAISGQVTIQGGDLTGNRTNLPGHVVGSAGGALMAVDSQVSVTGVRFQGNEAGWVGGAMYAIGSWDKGSTVTVARSTFLRNQALADPCCIHPTTETSGGALHAEDLTALRVSGSLFQDNRADLGGGISEYRADVEVRDSVFQGNRRTDANRAMGLGGAIAATSSDWPDGSTNFGEFNRRPARLAVSRSLIQGGVSAPYGSGCVLAGGDVARLYGEGQVAQSGTAAENRARVEIRGVVFEDCDADPAVGGDAGQGGALMGDLVDADVEDSLFLDSDARGPNGGGGAVFLRQESDARILRSTFAHDSAQKWGGALFVTGSTIQVDGCRFLGNDVVPGASERLTDSRGAAIYSQPLSNGSHPRNVDGVVANSVFVENLGIPIWDVEPASGPVNDLRYDGNRFVPALFGDRVYVHNQAMPAGASVAELNFLTVFRGVRGTARKSAIANAQIFDPRQGSLAIVPSPNSVGAAPSSPGWSALAYAWSGGTASVATIGLYLRAGLFEAPPGSYTLLVDGAPVATATAP